MQREFFIIYVIGVVRLSGVQRDAGVGERAVAQREHHGALADLFDVLMAEIQRNLEPSNRDRFTQHNTRFRRDARAFLTLTQPGSIQDEEIDVSDM